MEYKRLTGACPLRDFHKICRVCTPFQDVLAVGYRGFNLRVSGFTQIFSTPYRRNYGSDGQTTKSFRGARTCSRSAITVTSLVRLGFHPPPGWPKTLSFCLFVCLSVCLSVTLLNVTACAPDFIIKALEYRNDFDAVG